MISAVVTCRWCCDSKRVQLSRGRSHPCLACSPAPFQQALIPQPFRFQRPWVLGGRVPRSAAR